MLQNHRVERMWPEVNQRFNYPVKSALVELTNSDRLNMEDDLVKFCVSSLMVQLAEIGLKQWADAWNCHRVSGNTCICIPFNFKDNYLLL